MSGFEMPLPVIALGTVIGLTYGVLAVGLVLVYRSNRIINFAHGQVGAFGSALFGLLTVRYGVPYYLALPFGLMSGAAVGALSEVAVVRRLRRAPRIMSIVATLGVGEFLLAFSLAINSQAGAGSLFPQPPGMPVFDVGALRITQAYSSMIVFTPLVVVALATFLRRSRFGLAIRGAAANADVARMAGIFASRMSTLAWAIAGGLSAFSAILFAPSQGFVSGDAFGPSLLLRALVAAVIGRMSSMPLALAGGVVVGVVEQALLWNYPRGGLVEMMLFGIILVALLVQRRLGGREDEKGSWAAVQGWRPLPDKLRELWLVRNLGRVVAAVVFAVLAALPLLVSNSVSVELVGMFAFGVVALSVGIVTGLGGQLSLGQFALGAIGAVVSYYTSSRTGNFGLAFLYAGFAASIASLVIGLPALRLRGLLLTVTTLSFALATPAWLLQQPWMLGEGLDPGRPIVAGQALDTGRSYYFVGLVVLVVVLWLARNVRTGGLGRQLVAVRDNEDNARAFTVPASLVKVEAFMLAGFVAGVGGALYGHSLSLVSSSAFPSSASIAVAVMAVIGGLGILSGPLLGVLLVMGVPAFVPLDAAGLAATRFGLLVIILYAPGGLTQIIAPLRDRVVDAIARRAGIDPVAARRDDEVADDEGPQAREEAPGIAAASLAPRSGGMALPPRRRAGRGVLLEVEDVRRHFGGVRAVDGVSFDVRRGETLGLIGPNGAGKTTLFELIGGFTKLDTGRVGFAGQDITRFGPEARARLGLIRSFQDAALFPTMTVLDAVRLSLEKVAPTPFLRSLAGVDRTERQRTEWARELVARFGLERYRDKQIQELSTGTRRITEVACLVALEPTLLLLDEPSSGIAQRETEALGVLLRELKDELDTTMVIIEHDIPLIMGLADRIVAMDTGRILAVGTPEQVRHDDRVVSSYLGGSTEAIERSGAGTDAVATGQP